MITAEALYSEAGRFRGCQISGHGDMDTDDLGYDIVCAAVSSITLTAALGLRDVLRIEGIYESQSGFLRIDIGSRGSAESDAVLATMFRGLEEVSKLYPDRILIRKTGGEIHASV